MIESYGGGNSGGWPGLKKAEPRHGWDNELWMRLLLLFSTPPPCFRSPLMSFSKTPLGFEAYSLPLFIVKDPFEWPWKVFIHCPVIQSGLGYRFSQYAKVGGFFCEHPGCCDGICMCPFLHGMWRLEALIFLIFKKIYYYFGDAPLFQMNRKNLSAAGGKVISGGKSIICHIL